MRPGKRANLEAMGQTSLLPRVGQTGVGMGAVLQTRQPTVQATPTPARIPILPPDLTVPIEPLPPDRPGTRHITNDDGDDNDDGDKTNMEAAFKRFHRRNPDVYDILVRLAREWRKRHGDGRLGIGMLYERARWDLSFDLTSDDGFKLNNNHRAFYARLIMSQEADLSLVFELRRQRSTSTLLVP